MSRTTTGNCAPHRRRRGPSPASASQHNLGLDETPDAYQHFDIRD
jgi:hypothetical protein